MYRSVVLLLSLTILAGCASTQPYQTQKSITSIAFSPDQKLLAVANANEIRVLDVDSRKYVNALRELPQDTEGADPRLFRHGVGDSMVFLDDARIASTGMGGLVSIWDVRSGRRLALIDALPDEEEFASTIDYSPVTNKLVIGTSNGQILLAVINGNYAEPLVPLTKLESYVWDLQFSRDGRFLASASLMSSIPAADGSTDKLDDDSTFTQAVIDETSDDATYDYVGLRPDQSNVLVWNVEGLETMGRLEGAERVLKMDLVPGQQALLTTGEQVQVWEFLSRKQMEEVSDPSMVLQAIGFGTLAVVSVASLAAGVFTPVDFFGQAFLNTGFPFVPTAAFIQHACARTAAISPDGRTIVSTTWGPTHNVMAVIDRTENKVIEKWTADSAVCDLQFSSDGRQLVAATSRGAFIYDTSNWKKTSLKNLVQAGEN